MISAHVVLLQVFINHPKRKEEEVVVYLDRKYAVEDPQGMHAFCVLH